MSNDTLYRLMPAIYRQRDLKQGQALRAFMRVLESQYALIKQDIEALNDNWFIETCDDWAVPYIADLLDVDYVKGQRDILPSHRTLVANTVAHRRAKGTVAALARAAQEISGWRVFPSLGADALALTQSMPFVRPGRQGWADLRGMARAAASTAAPPAPRSVEVRVPRTSRGGDAGRYNLQAIALYMCRLQSFPLLEVEPAALGAGRYSFHPMGIDTVLFSPPLALGPDQLPASPQGLPVPLERARLREDLRRACAGEASFYFGAEPVFRITLAEPGAPGEARACALHDMAIGDLSDWTPAPEKLLTIDPELGRMLLRADAKCALARVAYHYGFSGDLGGGPYPRALALPAPEGQGGSAWTGRVERDGAAGQGRYVDLDSALADWRRNGEGKQGTLYIADNSTYRWGAQRDGRVDLPPNARLRIVALSGASPCIEGDLGVFTAGAPGVLELNGLWCTGQLQPGGTPTLILRHCTLRPGPRPSVQARETGAGAHLILDHCISGALELACARARLEANDSIIDAGLAIAGGAGLALTLQRCTVLGDVDAALELIADTLMTGSVRAAPDGAGEVRYSFARPIAGSRTAGAAQRYRSFPDPDCGPGERCEPEFTSRRFGDPGYCQLSAQCSSLIRTGAESGSEMGAFHQLSQHLRHQYLQRVIAEYLPYSMHAGVFFLT